MPVSLISSHLILIVRSGKQDSGRSSILLKVIYLVSGGARFQTQFTPRAFFMLSHCNQSQSQGVPQGLKHALLPSEVVPFCVTWVLWHPLPFWISQSCHWSQQTINVVLGLTIENLYLKFQLYLTFKKPSFLSKYMVSWERFRSWDINLISRGLERFMVPLKLHVEYCTCVCVCDFIFERRVLILVRFWRLMTTVL